MGTIHRILNSGGGGTETTDFIHCINGRDPHINKLCCLGLDVICRELHPTACVEIPDGTAGYFVTNYLAENGRWIPIIGQLSVNNSVQFLGLSDQAWGSTLLYIANLLAQVEAKCGGSSNSSNKNWGGHFNNANSIINISWGDSVDAHPTYLPWISMNPHAAQRRVCDHLLSCMRQERLWHQSNCRNPLVNPWVIWWGKERDGPEPQWLCSKFPLLVWVVVSGLRVKSPCASLAIAVFDS